MLSLTSVPMRSPHQGIRVRPNPKMGNADLVIGDLVYEQTINSRFAGRDFDSRSTLTMYRPSFAHLPVRSTTASSTSTQG